MADIIELNDLRNAGAISQRCHLSEEPIYVTKDGSTDLVILSIDAYEHLMVMSEVNTKLATAEVQMQAGLCRPLADFLKETQQPHDL